MVVMRDDMVVNKGITFKDSSLTIHPKLFMETEYKPVELLELGMDGHGVTTSSH